LENIWEEPVQKFVRHSLTYSITYHFTMPDYRRLYVPGGTYFFTLVTNHRAPLFADELARTVLGTCIRECQEKWSFEINAIVLLPDHLHAIWTLPNKDDHYSTRWGWIKKEFTKRLLAGNKERETSISIGRERERRRGIWQPRFWEHTIKDVSDFERHFDYIHYNPVKHGYVRCPHEWPHSSFHRWVQAGVYPWHWACGSDAQHQFSFRDIEGTVGE
jgi:putative transposase